MALVVAISGIVWATRRRRRRDDVGVEMRDFNTDEPLRLPQRRTSRGNTPVAHTRFHEGNSLPSSVYQPLTIPLPSDVYEPLTIPVPPIRDSFRDSFSNDYDNPEENYENVHNYMNSL